MSNAINRVQQTLHDLAQGKIVILTDDPCRENEGDLIVAADKITPELMNFMIRHGSGIVCLSLTQDRLNQLHLPLMVPWHENTSSRHTPFTISIDAKHDITTGVSVADRTKTVLTAIRAETSPQDLVRPGHIFPLQAKDGGVLERQGHTEGALDLARLAGLTPAAVLCELMNTDGSMMQGHQINQFALLHGLTMLSIDDLMTYRLNTETVIEESASTLLPLEQYGSFKMTVVKEKITGHEHIILEKESLKQKAITLVRIHSSCVTGDLFSSQRCNCNKELHYSLKKISEEGGVLIYLAQEGRGIGLLKKIEAYTLQENGLDTVEANEKLGLPIDSRRYYVAANILRNKNLTQIRLLTNNPNKVSDLKKYGILHVEREVMPTFCNEYNYFYLKTKKEKLNHSINLDQ